MAINNPVITDSDWLQATAVAIQNKDGGSKMEVPDFASRIDALPATPVLIPKTITENGTYAAEDDNADGYSEVEVDVSVDELKNYNLDEYIKGNLNEITTTAVNIRQYALAYCPLTKVNMPNAVTIGQGAFSHSNLSEVTELPDTITTIQLDGFSYSNISLTRLPNSLTFIGNTGFFNCSNLQITEIPKSYTDIGQNVFNGCTGIITLKMPSTLISIGQYAFRYCSGLVSVDMSEVVSIATISSTTFQHTDNCVFLFRDQAQLEAYASATNWAALAGRFQIKGATP